MTGAVAAIVGPTGAGKSARALEIARSEPGTEIVAVDAFTIYRGMDVGTAKPSDADRAAVGHHLVDVLEPDEEVSVAWFQTRARAAISDIHARGGRPLLVGGSGLYFRAVVDALEFPPTDPAVRMAIERRWGDDPAGAHAHLAATDPAAAAKIEPANLRRTVRALEVLELTGRQFSTFAAAWDRYESIYDLAVTYLDRETLRADIRTRAERMVADGLLEEAAQLRARFPRGLSTTARQAIGYAEAFAVLDGAAEPGDLADAIARRTWAYARRQRAWFRRDPRCVPH